MLKTIIYYIIGIILILAIISQFSKENPPEQLIMPNSAVLKKGLAITQGNSLLPYSPLAQDMPVFGVLIGNGVMGEWAIDWTDPLPEDIHNLIWLKYPKMSHLLIDLSLCESGWKHKDKWGDQGASYGAFQFQQLTFDEYGIGNRDNFENQLDATVKMIRLGLGHTLKGWYNCWRSMDLWKYEIY